LVEGWPQLRSSLGLEMQGSVGGSETRFLGDKEGHPATLCLNLALAVLVGG
jgi:hypothetical protein